MSYVLPDYNPAISGEVNYTLQNVQDGCVVKCANDSPFDLILDFPASGQDFLSAGEVNIYILKRGDTYIHIKPVLNLAQQSWPVNLLHVILYLPNEKIAGTYPFFLSRNTNIGNNVSTSNANSIILSGEVPPQIIISATPTGLVNTVLLQDTGEITLSPISKGLQPAALQIIAGDATHNAIVKLDAGLISTDGAGNLTIKSLISDAGKFISDGAGIVTLQGLNIGPTISNQYGIIKVHVSVNALEYDTPLAGINPLGHLFSTWTGTGQVVPFSIGGQFNSALSWIDAVGNYFQKGNIVAQTKGSGATNGRTLWQGPTDPGASASEGDLWFQEGTLVSSTIGNTATPTFGWNQFSSINQFGGAWTPSQTYILASISIYLDGDGGNTCTYWGMLWDNTSRNLIQATASGSSSGGSGNAGGQHWHTLSFGANPPTINSGIGYIFGWQTNGTLTDWSTYSSTPSPFTGFSYRQAASPSSPQAFSATQINPGTNTFAGMYLTVQTGTASGIFVRRSGAWSQIV